MRPVSMPPIGISPVPKPPWDRSPPPHPKIAHWVYNQRGSCHGMASVILSGRLRPQGGSMSANKTQGVIALLAILGGTGVLRAQAPVTLQDQPTFAKDV